MSGAPRQTCRCLQQRGRESCATSKGCKLAPAVNRHLRMRPRPCSVRGRGTQSMARTPEIGIRPGKELAATGVVAGLKVPAVGRPRWWPRGHQVERGDGAHGATTWPPVFKVERGEGKRASGDLAPMTRGLGKEKGGT
jgi:hypothetical protein